MDNTIVDVLVKRLEDAEQCLSDEAYAFLASYEDIDDVMVYQKALIEYIRIIEPEDVQDTEDIKTMTDMVYTINALINVMSE